MKWWHIARKDIRIRLRDRKGFLMMIVMPLVLTAILGAALSGVFNQEGNTMPEFEVAVYRGDDGALGKALVEDILQSDDLKKSITVKSVDSELAVQQSVQDGEAAVGLVIPTGFTDGVNRGDAVQVELIQDPGKQLVSLIMNSIVTSYTNRISAVGVASSALVDDLKQAAPVLAGQGVDIGKIAQEVLDDLKRAASSPGAGVVEKPVGEKEVTAQQYYSAAMAVMFLLFNATIGAKSILNERASETLSRMLTTPTNKLNILLGKFVGTLYFSLLQFAVLMLTTKYAFGVDWGDFGQAATVAFGYAIAVSGLSMALAAMLKSEQSADLVSGIGVQIFAALGGSMLPLSQFPELLQKVALITPNAWALTSLTGIMTGAEWQALYLPIGVLLAIGAVALSFGTWRLAAR
ncbi:ABC transporter permease [Tumebacillus lipolyticus]|uniref:ABC transporter permease n=1 Tax=Tumebacillus lipolyticus TaxID=1280370 RepID=A0ABW4ZW95_9BACL